MTPYIDNMGKFNQSLVYVWIQILTCRTSDVCLLVCLLCHKYDGLIPGFVFDMVWTPPIHFHDCIVLQNISGTVQI